MNYNNPELIERLSAEYVLGTLQGKARDRFERLMENSHRIRLAVWHWENHITPIAATAPVIKTPPHLWPTIKARIGPILTSTATKGRLSSLIAELWRWWSFAATAACLLLVFLLTTQQRQVSPGNDFDRIALVSNQQAQPQWLVSFDLDTGQLKARALNDIAVETGGAFELWLLPETGNPRSLGLLPVNSTEDNVAINTLTLALIELLRNATDVAVSLEPKGGSPTGLPTGPVVYQSNILVL